MEPAALRHLSYGGGRMPLELVERTLRDMPHVDLVNAYGLTETSSTIAMLTPDDHREANASEDPAVRARLGSVGRPLPSLEVEVRGEDEVALPPGEKGEIWVRGEQVAGEYVGRTTLTDEGWFRTRDAGWFDVHGFLYIDGRLDDVIVRGAENISPGEIEDVLMAHPAVTEAAVIGIPDAEWGEAVAAVVVLHAGQSAGRGGAAGLGAGAVALDQDARRRRLPRRTALLADGEAATAGAARRAVDGPRGWSRGGLSAAACDCRGGGGADCCVAARGPVWSGHEREVPT